MIDHSKYVFVNRRPGQKAIGYCWLPGKPRDAEGRLKLKLEYSEQGKRNR